MVDLIKKSTATTGTLTPLSVVTSSHDLTNSANIDSLTIDSTSSSFANTLTLSNSIAII